MNRTRMSLGMAGAWLLALMAGCQPPEKESAADGPPDGSDAPQVAASAAVEAPAEPAAAVVAGEPAPDAAGWIECRPAGEAKWEVVAGEGSVWDAAEGVLRIPWANSLGGVRWTGPVPAAPFEVELEARRTDGSDFFCGLTVPTRSVDECVTLIIGGWGGSLVGISSLNDLDASENQTTLSMHFDDKRWYRIRLRFAGERLLAWIDEKELINVDTTGMRLGLRAGPIEDCAPFGLATWECGGEMRGIRWRRLPEGG